MPQESLATLLSRERTLEQAISGLTQAKAQISHDLDTIQRFGTFRLIFVYTLAPIKMIATMAAPDVLQAEQEMTDLVSDVFSTLHEKDPKSNKPYLSLLVKTIKDRLEYELTKKGTTEALDMIPVVNGFYTIGTTIAELVSEGMEASELKTTINEQRENLNSLQTQIDKFVTRLNALKQVLNKLANDPPAKAVA